MKFKIIGDSCTDFKASDLEKEYIKSVPLTIDIGGYEVIDDTTFDQADFLKRVASYDGCPKSSCPSPDMYLKHFNDAEEIYVVTLSSHLSGSYNSACLAKQLYEQEHPEVKIHIFDSLSASTGQYLLVHEIERLALIGTDFEEIVSTISRFREEMVTAFVLENLDTLRKNGRLTAVKAFVANALNIKPCMVGDHGIIKQAGQARGMKRALSLMMDYIRTHGSKLSDKTLVISHCKCFERAKLVEKELLSRCHFKDSIIIDTNGISSVYANDGGIIVSC